MQDEKSPYDPPVSEPSDAGRLSDRGETKPIPAMFQAVCSLICGIGSFFNMGVLLGALAVGLGHQSLTLIKKSPDKEHGKVFAILGLLLGYASLITLIVLEVLKHRAK